MSLHTIENDLFSIIQRAISSGYNVVVIDGIIRIQDPADGGKAIRREVNFTVPKIEPLI